MLAAFCVSGSVAAAEPAVIEGRVTLPAGREAPVLNQRYEIVSKGGVVAPNPPVAVVFLAGDFPAMNEVYGHAFAGSAPARATVGVAALPLGARVEIEAVAVIRPG